ncbi:hypothetical protein [Pedobacter sp. MC2016-24]|uniref:hypothetical protein n=1 Tax=Pedobacter sp. MC2016-24 TaxID=2780090 RepID=UPI00187FA1AE|nr:hypothetical protein [Pedobacter sp. MC2016-24]MBE9599542.1 hypothetical protein [Pedobacter sp. MC2016-24]
MKNRLRFILLFFIPLGISILFYACRKDTAIDFFQFGEEQFTNPDVPMDSNLAKIYYKKALKPTQNLVTANAKSAKANKKLLKFKDLYQSETYEFTFVEIPLYYNQRPSSFFNRENLSAEDAQKVLDGSFDRLIIYKDKNTGKVDQRIIRFIPSFEYLQKNNNDISNNHLNKLDRNFNGYLKYMSWDGTDLYLLKIVNGRSVQKFDYKTINSAKSARTSETCETICSWDYVQNCWYSDPEHTQNEHCGEWTLVATSCWSECTGTVTPPVNPCPSGNCGGSTPPVDQTGNTWPNNILLLEPHVSSVVKDMVKYLECFNATLPATINIYVDQPEANTSKTWSGTINDPDVGHTFVSIEQTIGSQVITRVFGFYPNKSINPFYGQTAGSEIHNDGGHLYDVKVTVVVPPAKLAAALTFSKNYSQGYDLDNYNCTDFGLGFANTIGVHLPDVDGTWPGGGGSNPGNLGQSIRGLESSTNMTIKKTSGTAVGNTGNCGN